MQHAPGCVDVIQNSNYVHATNIFIFNLHALRRQKFLRNADVAFYRIFRGVHDGAMKEEGRFCFLPVYILELIYSKNVAFVNAFNRGCLQVGISISRGEVLRRKMFYQIRRSDVTLKRFRG